MFRYVFALFLLLFFRYAQYDVLAYIMSSMVGHYMKPWPWTVAIVLTLLLVLVGHGTELVLKKRTIHHRLPYVVVGWGAAAIEAAEKSPDVGRRYRCKYLRISLKFSNFTSNSNTL